MGIKYQCAMKRNEPASTDKPALIAASTFLLSAFRKASLGSLLLRLLKTCLFALFAVGHIFNVHVKKENENSVALVRERTIPTEQPSAGRRS